MRKILVLWQNELARIFKRTFILVMAIIMVVLAFLCCGGMKLLTVLSENNEDYYFPGEDSYIEDQIKSGQASLDAVQKKLSGLSEADAEYEQTLQELINESDNLEYFKTLKEYGLNYYSSDFTDECAYMLGSYRTYQNYPQTTDLSRERVDATADLLVNAIKNKDYKSYIDAQKARLEDSAEGVDERVMRIEYQALDYAYQCDPEGKNMYNEEIWSWKRAKIDLLENRYTDTNGNYLPLSDKLRAKCEDRIAVYEYKFEHGLSVNTSMPASMSASVARSICSSFLLFLLLILAGSAISSDIQSGAIKGLIIAPVKRSKIFIAKILALVTVALIGTLVGTVVSAVAHGVFFGFDTLPVYVYATGGTAHVLPSVVYLLAQLAAELVPTMMLVAFAMMLSALTRNTAVSVGISIAAYYLSGIAAGVLQMGLLTGEWIKFLPFLHMEVTSAFFPFSLESDLAAQMFDVSITPSLTFSLVYIAVATFTLGYMAFDSFTRRDI